MIFTTKTQHIIAALCFVLSTPLTTFAGDDPFAESKREPKPSKAQFHVERVTNYGWTRAGCADAVVENMQTEFEAEQAEFAAMQAEETSDEWAATGNALTNRGLDGVHTFLLFVQMGIAHEQIAQQVNDVNNGTFVECTATSSGAVMLHEGIANGNLTQIALGGYDTALFSVTLAHAVRGVSAFSNGLNQQFANHPTVRGFARYSFDRAGAIIVGRELQVAAAIPVIRQTGLTPAASLGIHELFDLSPRAIGRPHMTWGEYRGLVRSRAERLEAAGQPAEVPGWQGDYWGPRQMFTFVAGGLGVLALQASAISAFSEEPSSEGVQAAPPNKEVDPNKNSSTSFPSVQTHSDQSEFYAEETRTGDDPDTSFTDEPISNIGAGN